MNHIKTKIWIYNTRIIFKLFTTDIYTQNYKKERFKRLIIKKTWAIRLSVNPFYKF